MKRQAPFYKRRAGCLLLPFRNPVLPDSSPRKKFDFPESPIYGSLNFGKFLYLKPPVLFHVPSSPLSFREGVHPQSSWVDRFSSPSVKRIRALFILLDELSLFSQIRFMSSWRLLLLLPSVRISPLVKRLDYPLRGSSLFPGRSPVQGILSLSFFQSFTPFCCCDSLSTNSSEKPSPLFPSPSRYEVLPPLSSRVSLLVLGGRGPLLK